MQEKTRLDELCRKLHAASEARPEVFAPAHFQFRLRSHLAIVVGLLQSKNYAPIPMQLAALVRQLKIHKANLLEEEVVKIDDFLVAVAQEVALNLEPSARSKIPVELLVDEQGSTEPPNQQ